LQQVPEANGPPSHSANHETILSSWVTRWTDVGAAPAVNDNGADRKARPVHELALVRYDYQLGDEHLLPVHVRVVLPAASLVMRNDEPLLETEVTT
jgi:hypothetical protein